MRIGVAAICLLIVAVAARANAPSVEFGGQSYHLDYQDEIKGEDGQQGEGLAEFTLEGETVKNWTRLFAYYLFPQGGDDPTAMAAKVGQAVKEANPDANYQLYENKEAGTAIIDFLTWTPGSDVLEFNVFKYARAEYGPGLVALQYAQRFKYGDLDVQGLVELRKRSVVDMAMADIAHVRRYFAAKAKEQSTSAQGVQQNTAAAGADR